MIGFNILCLKKKIICYEKVQKNITWGQEEDE